MRGQKSAQQQQHPREIDHAQPVMLDGAPDPAPSPTRAPPRRSAALTVLEQTIGTDRQWSFSFAIRDYGSEELALEQVRDVDAKDVVLTTAPPPRRSVCKTGPRPCGFLTCPHHLWLVDAHDREGRRHNGQPPPPLIRASSRSTCALDLAAQENSAATIGTALGMGARRVQQIIDRALEKLRDSGENVEVLLGL